jgi:hypothetical protein
MQVPMLFGLSKDDALKDTKMGMWARDLGPSLRRIRLSVADNENFRTAFGLLRVSVATQADLDEYVERQGGASMFRSIRDLVNPMSIANEERMLLKLADMCRDYLSRYFSIMY